MVSDPQELLRPDRITYNPHWLPVPRPLWIRSSTYGSGAHAHNAAMPPLLPSGAT